MRKFIQVVPPAELRAYVGSLAPLEVERVPLEAALGRVLAEEVRAPEDLPRFRRSTMDGYAVKALDTTGASPSSPAYLKGVGEVLIGREAGLDISAGECCRIPTGAMLPEGADAVVMAEVARELPGGLVEISGDVAPGENMVEVGEDVRQGTPVLAAGSVLRPQDVGVLGGLGFTSIPVRRRPRVAILSTGDELVEPAALPGPAQVRNINQYALMAHVTDCGGEPRLMGIAPDARAEIERRAREGLEWGDMLIISGGSSVGTRDLTAAIIDSMGAPGVVFHGVATRPGKPTILGRVGEKVAFGLPGHPVSAMVAFINFVRPAILSLAGANGEGWTLRARLADNIHSRPGREDYVQVALGDGAGGIAARPIFKKSGMITSMTGADGWITIPLESEGLEAGDEVEVHLYRRCHR